MVAQSNIAGHLELAPLPESIVLPLLSGLLEWAVSPAAARLSPHRPRWHPPATNQAHGGLSEVRVSVA